MFGGFCSVQKIELVLQFYHQRNMNDWLIINKIDDVVGTSILCNYKKSRF